MPITSPAARKSVANSKPARTSITQPADNLPPVKTAVFDEHKEQSTDEQTSRADKTAGVGMARNTRQSRCLLRITNLTYVYSFSLVSAPPLCSLWQT